MNKKILSLIAIALMAVVPFKVSAAENPTDSNSIEINGEKCPVYNNYYLLHKYISSNDYKDESKANVSDQKSIAFYNVGIPSDAVEYFEGELKLGYHQTSLTKKEFAIRDYNNVWFDIIELNRKEEVSELSIFSTKEDNSTYVLHSRYNMGGSQLKVSNPFFWDAYMSIDNDDEREQLRDAIFDNGYIIEPSYINNYGISSTMWFGSSSATELSLWIKRSHQLLNYFDDSDVPKINMQAYSGTTNEDYYAILPNIYLIQYYIPSECSSSGGSVEPDEPETTTYTLKYDVDGGTGTPDTQTFTTNNFPLISCAVPEKEGYSFIGWSTTKGAEQANYVCENTWKRNQNGVLYAVWQKEGGGKEPPQEGEEPETGLGYSIGIISTILAATGGGIVYFKKRNKFENI